MPISNLRIGQKVRVMDQEGKVLEQADKIKIKFDSGAYGFFDRNEVTPIVVDSRMKGSKYDRMKAENTLSDEVVLMPKESVGTDPLAEVKKK